MGWYNTVVWPTTVWVLWELTYGKKRWDGKNTTQLIGFVLHVEKDKCNETNLKNVLNSVMTFVKQMYAKRDDNPAGEVLLDFMIDNTVGGARAGLPKHFFDNIRDEDKIKETSLKILLIFSQDHTRLCLVAPGIVFLLITASKIPSLSS